MKNGDAVSRVDGKIVFPADDLDDDIRQQFIPTLETSCKNSTFCEDIPNYPSDLVKTALRMNKNLESLSGVDLVPDVVHRVNIPPEDVPLCEYREELVYPKAAQSKDKEWLFVVNEGDFVQGVRIEKCKTESSTCTLIDGFAEGYKTSCKQKYIYRQLVAVSQNGLLKQEKFRFPASCCCHIKFTGNPFMRLGIGMSETTTASSLKPME
ncbi:hypothetical protein QAD02_001939 [Eretmocerus hayati]|uniref:Uncharacterized protein n=1 Tax=Eretmocerus hayati TaxID=131215 RepID=A0ACC2NM99_9HYME|nr:hypothetical protein QAD02_001939 [Eretmocerus hayati]